MKIRLGFVSNSSSSSFVIASKGKITEERIMKVFGLSKDTKKMVSDFFRDIVNYLVESLYKVDETDKEKLDYYDMPEDIRDLGEGWELYAVSTSLYNEDSYDKEINRFFSEPIEKDDLIIRKL